MDRMLNPLVARDAAQQPANYRRAGEQEPKRANP